jgi:diadenylate cyclase
MSNPLTELASQLPRITPTAVIDILCVAFLIYQFFVIIRGRRAAHILIGLGVVGLVYEIAVHAHLELLRTLLETLVPYTAFALIVVFQSEIRRMLARLGRSRLAGLRALERRELADEVLIAASQLSQARTGALIVLERQIGLRTFVESGVSIDGRLSSHLLCAIFHPGGALHDGAVIIQGDRVAAAACFLPLATNPAAVKTRGTRHRAAVGITEESDALAIAVSEETGGISVAVHGAMDPDVSLHRLEQYLTGRIQLQSPEAADPTAALHARKTGA